MRKLKIGMISFAHSHAASYFRELVAMPNVEVVGIADDVGSRVEPFYKPYDIPYYEDYRQLLNTDVEAVVICSENVHHAQMAIAAARAGKHILCEKPLGTTVEEMLRMVEEAAQHGVQLMTALPCRYLPAVIQAKEVLERGDIGEVLAIKGTNRGTMPGRWFVDSALSGGGAILDHTVHVLDLLRWMLGSEVVEVYAEAGTLFHNLPVEDAGMVHIAFQNGVVGVIDTSWSRCKSFPFWGDITMEIVGTEGVISVDAFAQKNEVYSDDHMKAKWSAWGDRMDKFMLQDFVQSILEGRGVPITGEDGLRSAAVALAAYESVKRQDTVQLQSIPVAREHQI